MSIYVDVNNESCSFHRHLVWQKLCRNYMQTFQTNFVLPAMLIGTIVFYHFIPLYIDFYHFIPLSSDLDLDWGSWVPCRAKPFGFIFLHTFQVISVEFDMVVQQFKMNILILCLNEIFLIKGSNCCFSDCIKKTNIGMHLDIYEMVWFKLYRTISRIPDQIGVSQAWHSRDTPFWSGTLDIFFWILYFDSVARNLDLHSQSQGKQTSAPIISLSFQLIGMKFGVLLRLGSVMILILILSCPFHFQRR